MMVAAMPISFNIIFYPANIYPIFFKKITLEILSPQDLPIYSGEWVDFLEKKLWSCLSPPPPPPPPLSYL